MTTTYSTVTQVRVLVQTGLNDPSAKEWGTSRIDDYINREHRWLFAELGRIRGSGYGIDDDEFTIAASTLSFDTSTMTNDADAPFTDVQMLWHQHSSGEEVEVEEASDAEFNKLRQVQEVSSDSTPKYRMVRRRRAILIQVLPLASAARNFRIDHVYVPPVLSESAKLHLPDEFNDIIDLRVRSRCLADENQGNGMLEKKIKQRMAEIRESAGGHGSLAKPRSRSGGTSRQLWGR